MKSSIKQIKHTVLMVALLPAVVAANGQSSVGFTIDRAGLKVLSGIFDVVDLGTAVNNSGNYISLSFEGYAPFNLDYCASHARITMRPNSVDNSSLALYPTADFYNAPSVGITWNGILGQRLI